VAGTAEFAGYDNTLTTSRAAYLVTLVESVFPEFAKIMDRKNLNGWSGLRPLSSDGLPLLGETKVPGLYLNTGHGGLGWTQSAGSGKALADTMVGANGAFDLSAFDPGRSSLSISGLAGIARRA
jgi:D-amino-acid dehydrogenase